LFDDGAYDELDEPGPHRADAPLIDERVCQALAALGHRWSVSVLRALWGGPLSYNRLRERVPEASPRMLTHTLRTLERHELVYRVASDSHRHLLYAPSDRGMTLLSLVADADVVG
jgi:DNA-binding HxlR family transcriptional regulator